MIDDSQYVAANLTIAIQKKQQLVTVMLTGKEMEVEVDENMSLRAKTFLDGNEKILIKMFTSMKSLRS